MPTCFGSAVMWVCSARSRWSYGWITASLLLAWVAGEAAALAGLTPSPSLLSYFSLCDNALYYAAALVSSACLYVWSNPGRRELSSPRLPHSPLQ
jgi:hypothetical protein